MIGYLFDQLARDLARGGSRREFVRRSTGFAAVAGLAHAAVPARWGRPVARLFGVPAPCESDLECGNCEDCRNWYGADVKTCGYLCQAKCSTCSGGQCVDTCPNCQTCYPNTEQIQATRQSLEDIYQCKRCDSKTGKLTDKCSACQKCVGRECVTNCPGRCETCDNGVCRKCDPTKCEFCADNGRCYTCDPTCERCNPSTESCETTWREPPRSASLAAPAARKNDSTAAAAAYCFTSSTRRLFARPSDDLLSPAGFVSPYPLALSWPPLTPYSLVSELFTASARA